jgi:hypothetical protein
VVINNSFFVNGKSMLDTRQFGMSFLNRNAWQIDNIKFTKKSIFVHVYGGSAKSLGLAHTSIEVDGSEYHFNGILNRSYPWRSKSVANQGQSQKMYSGSYYIGE